MKEPTTVCPFCCPDIRIRIIAENSLCYLIEDKYPVTEGHSLVIPRRHVVDYFGMTSAEQVSANALLQQRKEQLEQSDSSIDGFNIGMNLGSAAGQTIFHSHIHLIPRRFGDIEDPTGGVRFVIPEKANYKK